jgi:type I restriction enzyme S subunit
MDNLGAEIVGSMPISAPPLRLQRLIADYLDRETARLDALVAAKERLLGLLAEKRRVLITRVVTRGLDPYARLRDSGIPWLGEIPAHWDVQRLKFLAPRIEQGWSPECHNLPASDGEWGVLKAGCCNGGVFNQQENKSLPLDLAPPLELEVKPGDILMSRASGSTELIGSVALVPEGTRSHLLLSDKTYRIRLDTTRVIQLYFVTILGSDVGRVQVQDVISGAAGLANNIAQGDIKEFAIPLPPVDEQLAIVSYIAAETAKLDALRSATERTIALLKERRAALIAEAVTGRLDVQGSERHLDVVAD